MNQNFYKYGTIAIALLMILFFIFLAVESPSSSQATRNAAGGLVGLVVAAFSFLFIGLLYFLPSIAAFSGKHVNAGAILLLNLFLGWTFVGWVAALVWAASKSPTNTVTTVRVPDSQPVIVCRHCRKLLSLDQKFCPNCGEKNL